jgi:hypothetical protein
MFISDRPQWQQDLDRINEMLQRPQWQQDLDRINEMLQPPQWQQNLDRINEMLQPSQAISDWLRDWEEVGDEGVEATLVDLERELLEGSLDPEQARSYQSLRALLALRRVGLVLFAATMANVMGAGPALIFIGKLAHAILLKYPLVGLAVGLVDLRACAIAAWLWLSAADASEDDS